MEMTYFDYMGGKIEERSKGFCKLSLVVEDQHLNGGGVVHGGLLTSLADTAMGIAAEDSIEGSCATLDMNYYFLRAVYKGDCVETRGEIVKIGKSTMFAKAELFVGEKRVGYATANFFRFE